MLTKQHLIRMRIPEVHYHTLLSNIPDKFAYKKEVSEYIDKIGENIHKPKGLFLTGPCSAGKSAIGAIILKAAAYNGHIGLWVSARRLPEYIIEKVRFDSEHTMYDRARGVPILVIDEVQIMKTIKYTEQALETLVRQRIDDRLATILTTNHTKDEIKERYPSLYEALAEAIVHVKVSGFNFRDVIQKELRN